MTPAISDSSRILYFQGHTIDPSGTSPLVTCHHRPCHPEVVRVSHQG